MIIFGLTNIVKIIRTDDITYAGAHHFRLRQERHCVCIYIYRYNIISSHSCSQNESPPLQTSRSADVVVVAVNLQVVLPAYALKHIFVVLLVVVIKVERVGRGGSDGVCVRGLLTSLGVRPSAARVCKQTLNVWT